MIMKNVNVDKEDQLVAYNDEQHKYWVKGSNDACISVTTLIEKFAQPFDEDFWSSVKALEILLGDKFNDIRKEIYRTNRINSNYFNIYGISKDKFIEQKQIILDNWKKVNKEACERGTAIHKMHENATLGGTSEIVREFGGGGKYQPNTTNVIKFGEIASYPEVLLHYISNDNELRLAGQADLVLINEDQVQILDFKTNKEIKKKSHFNNITKKYKMMKYPLSNLMDSNYWHYAMQLSTYAWMIQQIDNRFNIKTLNLIHYDHNNKRTIYPVPYLKKEVEAMLKEYKRSLKTQELYNKIKPFSY